MRIDRESYFVESTNTFSVSTLLSLPSPFPYLLEDPERLVPHHTSWLSIGVATTSIAARQIRCLDCRLTGASCWQHRPRLFPAKFIPTLIHHPIGPPQQETHWSRWNGLPTLGGIRDALIGRLLTAPRDVATSEVSSRSFVMNVNLRVDVWQCWYRVWLFELTNKVTSWTPLRVSHHSEQ